MSTKLKNPFYFLLAGILIALNGCTGPAGSNEEEKQPNFLIIISDDQTYQSIAALNNDEIITPAMDQLANDGVVFSHSFNQGSWAGAVCVSSRTMLITGQSVFRTARNTLFLDPWAQLYGPAGYQVKKEEGVTYKETEVKTWAEVFSEAGYKTFITGKWHNSEYALLKGFNKAVAAGEGMYETFDNNRSNKMAYNRPNGSAWTPWDTSYSGHWSPGVKDIINSDNGEKMIGPKYIVNQHTSELYADKAIDFIKAEAVQSDTPFFMYVAFNAPHDPRQSPKEFVDMYPAGNIRIPDNFLPEHPFNQGDNRIRDEVLAIFPRTHEAIQLHRQEYYAIISHFDREMGRVIEALKESGEYDNTYIIFTSDHGLAAGQHGLMGKQNQYDHSIRMPLIIAGPGLEKSKRVDEMVYMQSVFATSCDLAGIEIPETVEFESLENMLMNKDVKGEDYIFGTYRHLQRMIRSREYKLIVYPEVKRIQLFNLIEDPKEINDLSADSSYNTIIDSLFDVLIAKQKELDDFLILDKSEYLVK